MARMPRVEYAGAIYHVINRGNYRRDLFSSPGAAESFLVVLEETAKRYGWEIGAYVLMRNHYHLAVRTPEPNISRGMQWLQVTFAARFNRFRSETGHLFQGRYRAILLENEWVWGEVCDYIHLNPVRAKIVEPELVDKFRWSSLLRFLKGPRFAGLECKPWLRAKQFEDSKAGWSAYVTSLIARVENTPSKPADEQEDSLWSRGWAMGSEAWRAKLADRFAKKVEAVPAAEYVAGKEAESLRWQARLEELLADHGVGQKSKMTGAQGTSWKTAIAFQMREEMGTPVVWLAKALGVSSPGTLRVQLHRWRSRVNK